MTTGMRTVIYPVRDLAQARALYSELMGAEPYTDQPYYVGFRDGDHEVGLDPHGHSQGMTGPIGYWNVPDIQERLDQLVRSGAEVKQAVRDVGGGKLIASVTDADGNVLGLIQPT